MSARVPLKIGDNCDRCDREIVGWPVTSRGDVCSPPDWATCIRNPKGADPPALGPIACECARCGAQAVIYPQPIPIGTCLCPSCSLGMEGADA